MSSWRLSLVAIGAGVASLGIFVLLAAATGDGTPVDRADHDVLRWIVDTRSPVMTSALRALTWLGSGWVIAPLVVIVVVFLACRRRWVWALFVIAVTVGTAVSTSVAKSVVGRQRPPPGTRLVSVQGPAFPSGHASQAMAFYLAVAAVSTMMVRSRRDRLVGYALLGLTVATVGYSRLYLGVHWLADVVGGFFLAVAWVLVLLGGSHLAGRLRGQQSHPLSSSAGD